MIAGAARLDVSRAGGAFADLAGGGADLQCDVSPTDIMLMLDADDTASGNLGSTHNNWPDSEDNHGAEGTCMNFCDGHAQWIKRVDYLKIINLSQDSNNTEPGP